MSFKSIEFNQATWPIMARALGEVLMIIQIFYNQFDAVNIARCDRDHNMCYMIL